MTSLNKKYRTRSGQPVRILGKVLRHGTRTVVAAVEQPDGDSVYLYVYRDDGILSIFGKQDHPLDLIEVSLWDDFQDGEPVMVRDGVNDVWEKMHFAKAIGGFPYTYPGRQSKWTALGQTMTPWAVCRKPTAEELAA